jgi:hypothetical protein
MSSIEDLSQAQLNLWLQRSHKVFSGIEVRGDRSAGICMSIFLRVAWVFQVKLELCNQGTTVESLAASLSVRAGLEVGALGGEVS